MASGITGAAKMYVKAAHIGTGVKSKVTFRNSTLAQERLSRDILALVDSMET